MVDETERSWDRLEYTTAEETTYAVLVRIGITRVETLKARHFASDQVHAVKYRDLQGQRQLAFCRLQSQKEETWRCNRLTLVPFYPHVSRTEKEPRFLAVPLGFSPFAAIGGYVIDPLSTVHRVRLTNETGQTLTEYVEDEMVLFLYDPSLFNLHRAQIEFLTKEGTIISSHRMLEHTSIGGCFSPPGIWAWPDPSQAVRHCLSTLSYAVSEQDQAREESIQIIKEQHERHHVGYAVKYQDLQGNLHICFCGVSQYDSGLWIVTGLCWESYLTDDIADLERTKQQPWLVFHPAFPKKEPRSLSERALKAPLGAGVIVDNGFTVASVRLLDSKGTPVLEDTVTDGLVLFLSEHVISPWLTAELYTHEGTLVGTHGAFRQDRGKLLPPQGRIAKPTDET